MRSSLCPAPHPLSSTAALTSARIAAASEGLITPFSASVLAMPCTWRFSVVATSSVARSALSASDISSSSARYRSASSTCSLSSASSASSSGESAPSPSPKTSKTVLPAFSCASTKASTCVYAERASTRRPSAAAAAEGTSSARRSPHSVRRSAASSAAALVVCSSLLAQSCGSSEWCSMSQYCCVRQLRNAARMVPRNAGSGCDPGAGSSSATGRTALVMLRTRLRHDAVSWSANIRRPARCS
mmetsp:Transcript_16671/g.56853  ORF Transcript_16671/g.56853 Transcript_16671/m.56853 type:complete len:244 (+) Transcript_16671:662-1393(+)